MELVIGSIGSALCLYLAIYNRMRQGGQSHRVDRTRRSGGLVNGTSAADVFGRGPHRNISGRSGQSRSSFATFASPDTEV